MGLFPVVGLNNWINGGTVIRPVAYDLELCMFFCYMHGLFPGAPGSPYSTKTLIGQTKWGFSHAKFFAR